jgi:hypothetical protein
VYNFRTLDPAQTQQIFPKSNATVIWIANSYAAQIFCQILLGVGQSKRQAQMDYLELDLFVAPMEMFMRQSVT